MRETIRMGVARGITFADITKEAISIAQKHRCNVEFDFGRQVLLAKPDSTEESLWAEYERLDGYSKKFN